MTRVYTMSPKKPNSAIRKARPTGTAAGDGRGTGKQLVQQLDV